MTAMREALDSLLIAASAAMEAGAAEIWLLDMKPPQSLTVAARCGLTDDALPSSVPLAERPLDQQAIAEGYAAAAAGAAIPTGLAHDACASLCFRLGSHERPLGTLHLYTTCSLPVDPIAFGRLRAVADLGAVALEASRQAAELEQVEARQTQFIHVTTHELRSPIAVSQTLVRNVVKGYAGPMTEKQQFVFGRISAQLDMLETLVNDLLDLAASRARGTASEGPVALNGPVGRAVLLLQPRAEEKGVAIEYHACRDEIVVKGTEEGLDRILVNLVGNSVKYTPAGGQVTVGLCQTGEEVFVTVADTGIGIPPEALAHLFEEFYRAPNARSANITGTGLGLAIVKELVEQYHGMIAVESTVGQGTTFTVIFPTYHFES
jgi:signal transduction histidine kinase